MKKDKKKRNAASGSNSEVCSAAPETTYEEAFIQKNKMQQRGNKTIYTSPDHHQRLTRIVQIIGDDRIPLYAYLHNILEHHFNVFKK